MCGDNFSQNQTLKKPIDVVHEGKKPHLFTSNSETMTSELIFLNFFMGFIASNSNPKIQIKA